MRPIDPYKTLTYALWSLAIALVTGIAYFTNKGLDLTDESMYLMDLIFPEDSNPTRKGNVLLAAFLQPLRLDIIGYRILRLLLTIWSAWILARSFIDWCRSTALMQFTQHGSSVLIALTLIGALGSYAIFPRTLSYNTLGGILAMLVASSLLRISSTHAKPIHFVGLGIFLAFQCFNKLPSGVALSMASALWLIVAPMADRSIRPWTQLGYLAIGATSISLSFWIIEGSPINWIQELFQTAKDDSTHSAGQTLGIYTTVILDRSLLTLKNGWYFLVIIVANYLLRDLVSLNRIAGVALNILMMVFGIVWLQQNDLIYQGGTNMKAASQVTTMLYFVCLVTSLTLLFKKKHRNNGVIMILMLAFPFLVSFGTNSDIIIHSQQYVVFPLLFLGGLLINKDHQKTELSGGIVTLGLAVIIAMQTWIGHTYNPYRIATPLNELNNEIITPAGNSLTVDMRVWQLHDDFESLIRSAEIDRSSTRLIVHSKLPGLNYLSGLQPVGSSWYSPKNPQINCARLESIPPMVSGLLIVTNADQDLDGCMSTRLKELGYSEKEKVNLGSLAHPQIDQFLDVLYFTRVVK